MYLFGHRDGTGYGDEIPRGAPMTGPRRQAQMDFESSLAPGQCRICKYANKASDSRCYQCGNIL